MGWDGGSGEGVVVVVGIVLYFIFANATYCIIRAKLSFVKARYS